DGYDVITASDGEEALRLVNEHMPALVLLDVMMPKIDGYEVCERIRADGRTRHISVIMLTAKSLSADKIVGLTTGADDYVLKPFDPMELVARVRSTLRRSSEMRAISPLTGLPGNIQIEDEIRHRHAAGEAIAVCYADLDNFKGYNDRYGFLQGDRAIVYTTETLREAAESFRGSFLGHVGGDDFVLVVGADEAKAACQKAIELFDEGARSLYEPEDAARSYIEAEDRRGRLMRYPILSLSIGVGLNDAGVRDYREIVDAATEMKAFAKRQAGSVYALDRRTHGT
ncbi:MAG: response regulator, partial [Actinobacteria bacterium]|nr:response regulator [Actinomycetota bacterium]